jgi:hypothetical protein
VARKTTNGEEIPLISFSFHPPYLFVVTDIDPSCSFSGSEECWDEQDGACVLVCAEIPEFEVPEDCDEFFWSGESGYRLTPNNQCKGGLELRQKRSCHAHAGGIAPILLTFYCLLALSISVVVTLYMKNRHFYNFVRARFPRLVGVNGEQFSLPDNRSRTMIDGDIQSSDFGLLPDPLPEEEETEKPLSA